ncbi:MAG: hypothetical protein AAGI44_07470 [Pseudomonadota bacterium]
MKFIKVPPLVALLMLSAGHPHAQICGDVDERKCFLGGAAESEDELAIEDDVAAGDVSFDGVTNAGGAAPIGGLEDADTEEEDIPQIDGGGFGIR